MIEYRKTEYQFSKELYDYYCNDINIAKLIDMKHKEADNIPETKIHLQNSMINATHEIQKLLIPFVYNWVQLPDKIDTSDKMSI